MSLRISRVVALLLLSAPNLGAQSRPATSPKKSARPAPATAVPAAGIEQKIEAYLRNVYAWGPSFQVKVGPLKDASVAGFYEVPVQVTMGAQSDSTVVYVSKDGRYLFRGDLQDMTTDPLAANRAQIRLANNPSKGAADARVVVVEYADFQCPSCRQLYQTLRAVEPNYPQVRVVFKDFPLTQVHPWAMTAAIAGRCAYLEKPDAFWKLHDLIFDNQEFISPENVWQKMLDLAGRAGLNSEIFRTCLASQQATQAVLANLKEGQALKVTNTPTVFVNGRRLVGGDRTFLEQFIQYELTTQPFPAHMPR